MQNHESQQGKQVRLLPGWLLGSCFILLFMGTIFAEVAHADSAPQLQSTVPPGNSTIPSAAIFLPLVNSSINIVPATTCPVSSNGLFSAVPVAGPPATGIAEQNPDFNLARRGYITSTAQSELVHYSGHTDSDAPQIPAIFVPQRVPAFTAAYRVYDWDWSCDQGQLSAASNHGCRGEPLGYPEVTMLGMEAGRGDPLHIPSRRAEIHGGGYIALVLYATEERLTLTYTREDSPAVGYMVHLEEICVDPNLLDLYRRLDADGRHMLPAIHNYEQVGTAASDQVLVAVRDTGSFMDPRSRKDWWQGH